MRSSHIFHNTKRDGSQIDAGSYSSHSSKRVPSISTEQQVLSALTCRSVPIIAQVRRNVNEDLLFMSYFDDHHDSTRQGVKKPRFDTL